MKGISKHIFYYISIDLINWHFLFSCGCTPWKKNQKTNQTDLVIHLGEVWWGVTIFSICGTYFHRDVRPNDLNWKSSDAKPCENVLWTARLYFPAHLILTHGIFCEKILLMENSKQTFIHILYCDDIVNFKFWRN